MHGHAPFRNLIASQLLSSLLSAWFTFTVMHMYVYVNAYYRQLYEGAEGAQAPVEK